jgi:transketolase
MDQINAAVHGKSSMVILGDVAGLTNSRNGKTHQTSGQPAALAMMPGVTLLEPWDKEDTFRCLNWAIGESRGIVYIRLHSSNVSQATNAERNLKQYVVRASPRPNCVVAASGIMVDLAMTAATRLSALGLEVRVINILCHDLSEDFVQFIDGGCPLVTLYNGSANVLLGNVTRKIMTLKGPRPSFVVGKGFDIGTTGGTEDLLHHFELDAEGIVKTISDLVSSSGSPIELP